jgi:hypothetical protein
MGVVATLVIDHLKQNPTKVGEGKEKDEYIIIRFDHVKPPINIINWYGQQESRTDKEDILQSWSRLKNELNSIENRGEGCLLIGDMNRAVGDGKWGVQGNKPNVSYGGRLMRDLLESEEYILLNNLSLVEGVDNGPWTMDMGWQG